MTERDAGFRGATCSGDSSSTCKTLCTLVAILCASAKHFVERAFDEAKETDKLNDEQDGHQGLLGAVCLRPVST